MTGIIVDYMDPHLGSFLRHLALTIPCSVFVRDDIPLFATFTRLSSLHPRVQLLVTANRATEDIQDLRDQFGIKSVKSIDSGDGVTAIEDDSHAKNLAKILAKDDATKDRFSWLPQLQILSVAIPAAVCAAITIVINFIIFIHSRKQ